MSIRLAITTINSTTTIPNFRFRDLPSEIRCKIYRILLCDDSLSTVPCNLGLIFDFARAPQSIDTAILRTCTSVYREAYDVMIKSNRFVKITSVRGLPMRHLLAAVQLAVVAEGDTVERFQGQVLSVHLSSKKTVPSRRDDDATRYEPCTIMIRYRDLEKLCDALKDGDAHFNGFSRTTHLAITMAPLLKKAPKRRYSPSFEEYFTEQTQQMLLAPFRNKLRGFKSVAVKGHISKDLGEAVCNDMKRDQWSDPQSILAKFSAAKTDGSNLFLMSKKEDAGLAWQDAVADMDIVHRSSSWADLIRAGGESFVSQFAEQYFLMHLNVAYLQITNMQSRQPEIYAELMAEHSLDCADCSLRKGFWMPGYRYQPPAKHLAKLHYRFALYLRLRAEPEKASQAVQLIKKALELQPGDSAILKEKKNILAWMRVV